MDPIVINISSEKLLDVIMKEDHEAILAIKKGVLDNWAHKNIRPRIDQGVANQLISDIDAKIRTTIKDAIKEHFKYEELEPYVREQTVKIINKMIDEELGVQIQKRVQEIIAKQLKKIK
jgi:hypothetical protein